MVKSNYATGPIDREYALNQAKLGYQEAETSEEKRRWESLIDFLTVLPSPDDLEEQVYCTNCEHFSADEANVYCKYKSICQLRDAEDSAPRRLRWCYSESSQMVCSDIENGKIDGIKSEDKNDVAPTAPIPLQEELSDAQSLRALIKKYGDNNTTYTCSNAEGELVWLSIAKTGIIMKTCQRNGTVRVNYYDKNGYDKGETFEGCWK